jgi:hypothetical protein
LPDFIQTGTEALDTNVSLWANQDRHVRTLVAKRALSGLFASYNLVRSCPANRLPQTFFGGYLEKCEVLVSCASVPRSLPMTGVIWKPNLWREKIAST